MFRSLGDWDWRGEAGRINVPTLIVHGEIDLLVPQASSEEWARLIPDSRLVILRGAGHVPWWEHEHEMLQLMRGFAAEALSDSSPKS